MVVLRCVCLCMFARDCVASVSIAKSNLVCHEAGPRGCWCTARAPPPHRGNYQWSNAGAPSQGAPPQTAHRTLEMLGCKHNTCLPGFVVLVVNTSRRHLGNFVLCWNQEDPRISPKLARARRRKSALPFPCRIRHPCRVSFLAEAFWNTLPCRQPTCATAPRTPQRNHRSAWVCGLFVFLDPFVTSSQDKLGYPDHMCGPRQVDPQRTPELSHFCSPGICVWGVGGWGVQAQISWHSV